MTWNSLRLRLVAGGAITIVIALTIAGAALTLLFERHVVRTVAADLEVYLNQLLAGIDIDADNRIIVNRPPADPRFADPLSGLYWQISDDRDQLLRSRSLWDMALSLPVTDAASTQMHSYEIAGPAGARLLVAERRVTLTIGKAGAGSCRCGGKSRARVGGANGVCKRPQARARASRARSRSGNLDSGRDWPASARCAPPRRRRYPLRAGKSSVRARFPTRFTRSSMRSMLCSTPGSRRSSVRAIAPPISRMA